MITLCCVTLDFYDIKQHFFCWQLLHTMQTVFILSFHAWVLDYLILEAKSLVGFAHIIL